ncbi:MAG TPA: tRNA pseudouridine(38-40) synthase TruA [Bdellovibrionales bacterium]|nr:tRNA pseudouridine(38-40) synthase TruA [Bdellovibrionales bacterium]
MRKIKLLISYDGSPFEGWQKQPGRMTVQGTLENVLTQIYSEPIRTIGSGRTDAGTHAVGQVVHFEAPKILSSEPKLLRSLNALLPPTIAVKNAWLAPEEFHALASARRKTYIYRIWNHPVRSALWHQRALNVTHPLRLDFLNGLARQVIGRKDFKSFQNEGTPVKSTVRVIDTCVFVEPAKHLIELRIRGNGFLKQMVRNLVGTMLYLERNDGSIARFRAITAARDRQAAKATAPAHGLYLYKVEYPPALDNKCRKL